MTPRKENRPTGISLKINRLTLMVMRVYGHVSVHRPVVLEICGQTYDWTV